MKNERLTVHMVPSTHWDREWYLPFRRYQVRLVRVMDKIINLLESGKNPYFVLDGQTIMIEDYLEVKPWMKERLHKLIKEGKMIVGPWYVVPDMFIPCGESLWKNLEIGYEIKKAYEGSGRVGYSPDSFGSTGQIPQLYAHFGNAYSMYTHGLRIEAEPELSEHNFYGPVRFMAPDGTEVLAESGTYSLGADFVVPTVWKDFSEREVTPELAVKNMTELLTSKKEQELPYSNRLVICGIDHIEPRENFPDLIKALNEAFPDVEFKASNLDLYFEALTAEISEGKAPVPKVAFGEQRGNYNEHFCRSNTASARVDIKMLNRRAENSLFSYVSGLNLYNKPCTPFEFLDRDALIALAERELVKSHPHDSICCCSVDEVNKDVKNRLIEVTQIADEILKDDIAKIGASLNGHGQKGMIMVYNCLPFERSMMVEGDLSIPYRVEGNCICEDGKMIEDSVAEVLFYKRRDIETMKYTYFEELAMDETRFHALGGKLEDQDIFTGIHYRFRAENVPAMGFKCYHLGSRAEAVAEAVTELSNVIENECIRLTVNENGSVDVLNKKSGKCIFGAHVIECSTDDGDEYTYSNPRGLFEYAQKAVVTARSVEAEVSAISVAYEIKKPGGEADQIQVISTFRLEKGSDLVKVQTEIQNETEDFRIRALFRTPGNPQSVFADTAFDLTERQVFKREELGLGGIVTMSMRNMANVPAEDYDLAIYSKSSQEFETIKEEDQAVTALTLLRSIKRVYVTNTLTRDETILGLGTRWFTKEGTMPGKIILEYAFALNDSAADAISRCNAAFSYQLPLQCYGITAKGDRETSELGMKLTGAVLSRIDKKGDTVYARIFNPANEESKAVLSFASGRKIEVLLSKKKIVNVDISGEIR